MEEGIQWLLRTSRLRAPTVELNLLSVLRNKSSSHLKAIPTNRSGALPAVRQGRHGAATEAMATATDPSVRCSPQSAPSVARIVKCRFNPVKVDRYIVVTATIPSDKTDDIS